MKTETHTGFNHESLRSRTAMSHSLPRQAPAVATMAELLSVVRALLGTSPISAVERAVLKGIAVSKDPARVRSFTDAIRQGDDPLGAAYCLLKCARDRRPSGQTFTPDAVVRGMLDWAARESGTYARVVDPGAGSGRFTLAALHRFPKARAIAVELDPVLTLLLRANAAVLGFTDRLDVAIADFRRLSLPAIKGKTLFIGNPPYVRHHGINTEWKNWYSDRLKKLGHGNSQLAGLHLHFFLKVLELARKGDEGCFITAAEWLDVNYGKALRDLLSNGLGGKAVFAVAPELCVFDDALVSAAIACFAPGSLRKSINFKRIKQVAGLARLDGGRAVALATAHKEHRWSPFLDTAKRVQHKGFIPLGDLFQVKRGQVTGLNRIWVAGASTPAVPRRFLVPCITDSFDISDAPEHRIASVDQLRRVIDLPASLDGLPVDERKAVDSFLKWAEAEGAAAGYVAQHRKPWWRVNLKDPAPVVMTYMGRRPPVFALNAAGARLINVAHGLYLKQTLSNEYLVALVRWLNANVTIAQGRAYAGGLIKFEPSEVMRLRIPPPSILVHEKNNNARFSETSQRVDLR
ncbi:MAG TPA: class I SAM-dependent methyltransferase [Burkholderiales bacterium]|nr:class I SAM-dependent methyltransferase [Burkholderiales bacterium]